MGLLRWNKPQPEVRRPLSDQNVQRALCFFTDEGEQLWPLNHSPAQVDEHFRRHFELVERRLCSYRSIDTRYSCVVGISFAPPVPFQHVDFGAVAFNDITQPHSAFLCQGGLGAPGVTLIPREHDALHDLVFYNTLVRVDGYSDDMQWQSTAVQIDQVRITPERQVFLA